MFSKKKIGQHELRFFECERRYETTSLLLTVKMRESRSPLMRSMKSKKKVQKGPFKFLIKTNVELKSEKNNIKHLQWQYHIFHLSWLHWLQRSSEIFSTVHKVIANYTYLTGKRVWARPSESLSVSPQIKSSTIPLLRRLN